MVWMYNGIIEPSKTIWWERDGLRCFVRVKKHSPQLRTGNSSIESLVYNVEEILFNPNVAYLLLVSGMLLAIMAVLNPGTGLIEVGALFALLLAGWGVYNLPVNFWALFVLVLGVFPFILAVRRSGQMIYLGLAILSLVIASTFLFRGEGWTPAVHPILAIIVSTLTSVFLWMMVTKTLEATSSHPGHDLQKLVGAIGEAKTDVHLDGTVQVLGELWSAHSIQSIPAGSLVRVVGREGFSLEVERAE